MKRLAALSQKIFNRIRPAAPPKSNPGTTSFYRPELDALRFFAFLSVFVHHSIPDSPALYQRHLPAVFADFVANIAEAGSSGVVLFFMLSSYLITALLLREQQETGTIKLMAFYTRRALRIWPLYFAFLLGCMLLNPVFGWPAYSPVHLLGFGTFTANWAIAIFGPIKAPGSILWSVSVEEQFYLIWPLLLLFFGARSINKLAWGCIVIAQFARVLMIFAGAESRQLWLSTFSHIDSIAVGALIAHAFQHGLPKTPAISRVMMLLTGVLVIVLCRGIPEPEGSIWSETIMYPATTLGCALVLLAVIGMDYGTSPAMRSLIYLGKISYGLYIFHRVVTRLTLGLTNSMALAIPLALVLTIAVAAASYQWLELPFLKLKKKFAVVESRSI